MTSQPHLLLTRTWTVDARETEIRGCLEALIKTQSPGGGGGWRRGKGGWWRGRKRAVKYQGPIRRRQKADTLLGPSWKATHVHNARSMHSIARS